MPKFLITGSYTIDGIRGVKAKGGSARREVVEEVARSLGGSVESVYFAFGENDFYTTVDLPDNTAAMAFSLEACSSGGIQTTTVVLLTPEEMDAAGAREVGYRPPGA
jgi:uncharacterized protein with GYD domain